MRLWSLHPRYLDAKGLVALWREGLLARKVLAGETRGYRHHPQLARFHTLRNPLAGIDSYLHAVCDEADTRGYAFDRSKLGARSRITLRVTDGQLRHELEHLKNKLATRDPERLTRVARLRDPDPHPRFTVLEGGIADWERITDA